MLVESALKRMLLKRGSERDNERWEQNLTWNPALSVASFPILCFVAIIHFPVPRARCSSRFLVLVTSVLKRIKIIFPKTTAKSQLRIICKQFWYSWSIREKSEKSNKARRAASRHKDYQLPKCQKKTTTKKNGSGGCVNVTIGCLRDETRTEKMQ